MLARIVYEGRFVLFLGLRSAISQYHLVSTFEVLHMPVPGDLSLGRDNAVVELRDHRLVVLVHRILDVLLNSQQIGNGLGLVGGWRLLCHCGQLLLDLPYLNHRPLFVGLEQGGLVYHKQRLSPGLWDEFDLLYLWHGPLPFNCLENRLNLLTCCLIDLDPVPFYEL